MFKLKLATILILTLSPMIHCITAKCGNKSNQNPKSAEGLNQVATEYPWHVSIYKNKALVSSGVLVSERSVLTVVKNLNLDGGASDVSAYEVVVGKTSTEYGTIDNKLQHAYKVKKITLKGSDRDTLALIVTQEKVQLNSIVQPVCIPSTEQTFYPLKGSVAEIVLWDKGQKVIRKITDFMDVKSTIFSVTGDLKPTKYDSGSGLFFPSNLTSSTYLHAILNDYNIGIAGLGFDWPPKNSNPVMINFINLNTYLEWITKHVAQADALLG